MKLLFLIQFILFFAFSSFASIKPKLIGRTHINKPGYNLPGYSTITNSSPQINNSGDILINLTSTNNSSQPGLWLKRAHDLKGKTIVLGRENEFFSSPSFNKDLQIVYHHYTDGDTYGIKKYQFDDDKITSIISLEQLPLTTSFSFPQINLQNHVL
ncbi:MAG: hypothetical protein KDD50_13310, partial [Bdellovibrionales bacterium]|nr:hypothetical protein [Bdellovibrionales bacterium]